MFVLRKATKLQYPEDARGIFTPAQLEATCPPNQALEAMRQAYFSQTHEKKMNFLLLLDG